MADITLHNPISLAPAIGFSHAAVGDGWVWLGGQIGSDASGKIVHPDDIVGQFSVAIQNVTTALRAAGSAPEQAVKLTYFVTDISAYRAALEPIGVAYRAAFGRHYPATSLFEVKGLFDPEAMIEIECVALVSLRAAAPETS